MPRRSRPLPFKRRDRSAARVEWIGGRLAAPFYVDEGAEPYRPDLVLWIEEPTGLVVGQDVTRADAEGAVGRLLLAALEQPMAGPPRRPDAIRVADTALASEVRAAVGDAIPTTVAPTPELETLLGAMLETMPPAPADHESYLEGGRIPAAAVGRLFIAARVLYAVAPWKAVDDDQVLRLDIPALGVRGACVSIIGSLGEVLGFIIFPSLASYDAFVQASAAPFRASKRRDLGTDWMALNYERRSDLPAGMRREVDAHRWPVAGDTAYPRVDRRDRDGVARPLVARDLEVASACAMSLASFFIKHQARFARDDAEPLSGSFFDENDLEVRFTYPYEAFSLFEVAESATPAPRSRAAVGRNDPCPCGSGRKYKKCHLPLDEEAAAGAGPRDTP